MNITTLSKLISNGASHVLESSEYTPTQPNSNKRSPYGIQNPDDDYLWELEWYKKNNKRKYDLMTSID